jgi:trigger factor
VRVELDSAAVDAAFDAITKDYQKQASLPGFRPGKAPRALVVKKYEVEIKDEAKRKLIGDAYRKAIDEQKLKVIGYPDIEEVQFGQGQALQFTATVETAPEFQLPEYKGIPATLETKSVTDADVDRALEMLRGQQANFNTVVRPLATGDVAVVNYTGTSEGKAITELAPTAKGLTEQKNFWIETTEGAFIPGFAAQLIGAQAGDKRTVNVDFPADFVTPQLQGKKGVYEVELVEVKEKVLPPFDDEFAKKFGAASLEILKTGVRTDLENELKFTRTKAIRAQTVRALLDKVQFDLPETAVAAETRNVVFDLVQQNTKRGVARELIETQKDEIYAAAATNAKERVKLAFLVGRIAEQEKIEVTQDDALKRAQHIAQMNQIPLDQFIKDLQKRNGVNELYEQVLHEKVLALIEQHAVITETPAK